MSETSDMSVVRSAMPAAPDTPKKKIDLTRDVCAVEAVLLRQVEHVKDLVAEQMDDCGEAAANVINNKLDPTPDVVVGKTMDSADGAAEAAAASAAAAAELLKWKDMPKHLQFNRYIVEGYRPLTDVKGCLHSLFYFHNETINIITHGTSILLFLNAEIN